MFTLVAFAGIEISTALQTPLRDSVVIVFSVSGLYDPLQMRSTNFFGLPTFLTEFVLLHELITLITLSILKYTMYLSVL